METIAGSRRWFIGSLIFIPLFVSGIWRYLKPDTVKKKRVLTILLTDIPTNGALVFRESRVVIMRNEHDVSAFSLICTHLGCTLTVTPTDMVCPCHGSRFSLNGKVVKGPAGSPLTRLGVELSGNTVHVYGT